MERNKALAARAQVAARDDRSMRWLEALVSIAAIASVVLLAGIR
ncbi:MAG TPA: hypothetical protein VFK38_04305 [Candidatus Limnocylindrales bacterium]|nr:hypothetical protein [Candidatus Limnocylindrales bacterium]